MVHKNNPKYNSKHCTAENQSWWWREGKKEKHKWRDSCMQTSLLPERRSSSLAFLSLSHEISERQRKPSHSPSFIHPFASLSSHFISFLFFSLSVSPHYVLNIHCKSLSLLYLFFLIIYLIFKVYLFVHYRYLFGWIKDIWVQNHRNWFFEKKKRRKERKKIKENG